MKIDKIIKLIQDSKHPHLKKYDVKSIKMVKEKTMFLVEINFTEEHNNKITPLRLFGKLDEEK